MPKETGQAPADSNQTTYKVTTRRDLSRRDFVRISAASLAGLALAACTPQGPPTPGASVQPKEATPTFVPPTRLPEGVATVVNPAAFVQFAERPPAVGGTYSPEELKVFEQQRFATYTQKVLNWAKDKGVRINALNPQHGSELLTEKGWVAIAEEQSDRTSVAIGTQVFIDADGKVTELPAISPQAWWDFDVNGNPVLLDRPGNKFAVRNPDSSINWSAYGVVTEPLGLPGVKLIDSGTGEPILTPATKTQQEASFGQYQPLLVTSVVRERQPDGSLVLKELKVAVSTGKTGIVSPDYFNRLKLGDNLNSVTLIVAAATPTPRPTEKPTAVPTPTEFPRPALVTDFPTYGGHTDYTKFAPDGTLPIYQKMYPNGLGEQLIVFSYLRNEDMFTSLVTGKRYGTEGIPYDKGTVWFGDVKDSYFTGKTVDGKPEFVIDLLTSDNITIKLIMSNNVVITNAYSRARDFYQVPGTTAGPGLVRPGKVDASGKLIPKDVAGLSNSTLVKKMLQGHTSGDTVEINVTGHKDDISYALIVFSKQ